MNSLHIRKIHKEVWSYRQQRNSLDKIGALTNLYDLIDFRNINNMLNRNLLPAYINMSTGEYTWYKNGQMHNLYGHAYININYGRLEYYIHGIEHTKEDWEFNRKKLLTDE